MELTESCNNLSKTHNIFLETDNTVNLYSKKLKYSRLLTEYVTQNSEEETGLRNKVDSYLKRH
jgi:hypothetical protein